MEKDTPNSIKRKCSKEIDDVDSEEEEDDDSEDDDSDDYSEKDESEKNKTKSLKKSPSEMDKLVCETCGENVGNEEYIETKDYIFCSEECMERGPIHEKQGKKVLSACYSYIQGPQSTDLLPISLKLARFHMDRDITVHQDSQPLTLSYTKFWPKNTVLCLK